MNEDMVACTGGHAPSFEVQTMLSTQMHVASSEDAEKSAGNFFDARSADHRQDVDSIFCTDSRDVFPGDTVAAANEPKYGLAVADRRTYSYDRAGNQRIDQPPAIARQQPGTLRTSLRCTDSRQEVE